MTRKQKIHKNEKTATQRQQKKFIWFWDNANECLLQFPIFYISQKKSYVKDGQKGDPNSC